MTVGIGHFEKLYNVERAGEAVHDLVAEMNHEIVVDENAVPQVPDGTGPQLDVDREGTGTVGDGRYPP